MKKVFIVVLLLLLFIVIAIPAGATEGEEVTITISSEYTYWPGFDLSGTWNAAGAIDSSGELLDVLKHFGAGSPQGKPFQTAHLVEVIGDDKGTITLSSQVKDIEFSEWAPCATGMCQHYEGAGRWVILSGTGDYANAHGVGTLTAAGDAYLVIDESGAFHFEGQDVAATYTGMIHFDPS
jgi:hypothetical protein